MKILHLIHTMRPEAGGVVEAVRLIASAQTKIGHQAEVLCLDAPGTHGQEHPFPLHQIGPSCYTYGYCRQLKPWLRQHCTDYDVVIVHGLWQYVGLAVRSVLRTCSTPYFVYSHGMLDPWFNQAYPRKHLKKRLYWRWGEYRVLRDAKAVLFTCEEERIRARTSFSPYEANEVVVGLGIEEPPSDLAQAGKDFARAYPQLRRDFLLFLGRIDPKKGLDLLILAYEELRCNGAQLPQLVLAGPGEDSPYAQQLRELNPAQDIVFTGMLKGSLKWGALDHCQVLILPSHQENFGIVVAEAFAVGKPALISDKVNIWREVAKAGAGLVQPDTLLGTQQLLHDWLSRNLGERTLAARAAQKCYQQNFAILEVAQRLTDVLEQHA